MLYDCCLFGTWAALRNEILSRHSSTSTRSGSCADLRLQTLGWERLQGANVSDALDFIEHHCTGLSCTWLYMYVADSAEDIQVTGCYSEFHAARQSSDKLCFWHWALSVAWGSADSIVYVGINCTYCLSGNIDKCLSYGCQQASSMPVHWAEHDCNTVQRSRTLGCLPVYVWFYQADFTSATNCCDVKWYVIHVPGTWHSTCRSRMYMYIHIACVTESIAAKHYFELLYTLTLSLYNNTTARWVGCSWFDSYV